MKMVKPVFHLVVITALLTATRTVKSPANSSDEYLESCGPDQTILLRKKRFLTFPPRSELLFRISLLKSTPWKTNVFTIHEIDVQVPVPENLHAILFHTGSTDHKTRSEVDNSFLEYLKAVVDIIGFNDRDCPERLQCELLRIKSHFLNKSFLLRVLHLLLRPQLGIGETILRKNQTCSEFFTCPVSFVPEFMMEETV